MGPTDHLWLPPFVILFSLWGISLPSSCFILLPRSQPEWKVHEGSWLRSSKSLICHHRLEDSNHFCKLNTWPVKCPLATFSQSLQARPGLCPSGCLHAHSTLVFHPVVSLCLRLFVSSFSQAHSQGKGPGTSFLCPSSNLWTPQESLVTWLLLQKVWDCGATSAFLFSVCV